MNEKLKKYIITTNYKYYTVFAIFKISVSIFLLITEIEIDDLLGYHDWIFSFYCYLMYTNNLLCNRCNLTMKCQFGSSIASEKQLRIIFSPRQWFFYYLLNSFSRRICVCWSMRFLKDMKSINIMKIIRWIRVNICRNGLLNILINIWFIKIQNQQYNAAIFCVFVESARTKSRGVLEYQRMCFKM